MGIAALTAVEVGAAERITESRLEDRGIQVTGAEIDQFKEFLLRAEEAGRANVPTDSEIVRVAISDNLIAHVDSFEITFLASAGIALLGALACFVLVRREDRLYEAPVFSRRSRWFWASAGLGPGITRRPAREPSAED